MNTLIDVTHDKQVGAHEARGRFAHGKSVDPYSHAVKHPRSLRHRLLEPGRNIGERHLGEYIGQQDARLLELITVPLTSILDLRTNSHVQHRIAIQHVRARIR